MGFEQACDSMHAAAVLGGDQNATANAHPCLTSGHHGVNNSDSNVSNQTGAVAGASGRRTSGGRSKAGASLFFANVAYWMCAGAYTPFLSSYFTSIGMTAAQIGVLLTISPLAVVFIQPLWARLSDATGKRRLVLALLSLASAASALLYYLGTSYTAVLVATIVFVLFFSALLPLCDALVIQGCSDYEVEFAHVRMGGTCGYAFVVFIVGMFLERLPQAQFVLVCVLSLLMLLSVLLLPGSPGRKDACAAALSSAAAQDSSSLVHDAQSNVKPTFGIFRSQEIFFILAFAFVSQMGLGFSGSFLGRYVVELGYSQGLVGMLSAVSALSELPILLFSHALVARFGVMSLLGFSCIMMVARLLLIGMGLVPTMVAGQLLQSVTYMTVYYCCTCYVAESALPGKLSQGQSVFVLVQSGLAMMVANLAGGAIGDAFGMRLSYFLTAGLVLTGTFIVMAAYHTWRSDISRTCTPASANSRGLIGSGQAVRQDRQASESTEKGGRHGAR